jgi:plasmid maintenance system antidote protein VapI
MWLKADRAARLLHKSGVTRAMLAEAIGVADYDLTPILDGQEPADMETAEKLISAFGARAMIWAIDWHGISGRYPMGAAR